MLKDTAINYVTYSDVTIIINFIAHAVLHWNRSTTVSICTQRRKAHVGQIIERRWCRYMHKATLFPSKNMCTWIRSCGHSSGYYINNYGICDG